MNEKWSDLNKKMQMQIKKKGTFYEGIDTLLELRKKLMKQIIDFKEFLKGYHNKTNSYSLYHIFRIEDIVTNSLIKKESKYFLKITMLKE